MGNLFEYVNLKKQTLKSKEGRDYVKYIVVSDVKGETFKVKDKLKQLGFRWDSKNYSWYIFGNELTNDILNGIKEINNELKTAGGQTENIEDFVSELEELRAEVQESNMPTKTKAELDAKIEQYIEDIANATDERAADAEIQRFLNFSRSFHSYSFSNIALIYLQDRNATKVAGRNAWKKQYNREVIDEKKSIWIWCINKFFVNPKTGQESQYSLQQQKKDNDYLAKVEAGQEKYNPDEVNAIKSRRKIVRRSFKPCEVYDIANTQGDPIPEEPKWKGEYDDSADAIALFNIAKKSLEKEGVRVTQDSAFGGEGGFSAGGHINISAGAKGTGAASTIFHEWAHELLHQKGGKFESRSLEYFEKKNDLSYAQVKQIKEIQAETVSAVICKYYGLPTEHHPTYMALWQGQGKLSSKQLINENMKTVLEVSNYIIHQIDTNKEEFAKAKVDVQPQQPQQQEEQ
jgi:hypothetical protein